MCHHWLPAAFGYRSLLRAFAMLRFPIVFTQVSEIWIISQYILAILVFRVLSILFYLNLNLNLACSFIYNSGH